MIDVTKLSQSVPLEDLPEEERLATLAEINDRIAQEAELEQLEGDQS